MLILHRSKVCVLLLLGAAGMVGQTRVPGKDRNVISPDGRLAVVNVDRDEEPHHCLYLSKQSEAADALLYCYPRHAQVFWSPDGKWIGLTDYFASDQSRVLLLSPTVGNNRIDVTRAIMNRRDDSKGKPAIPQMSHLYSEIVRWKSNSLLEVKFRGYGDDPGHQLAEVYDYSIDGKVVRVR